MSEYHTPVLLDESVSALITNPSGIYIDATFGGGGHTAEILSRLSPSGRVIAFDRDSAAIGNRIKDPRLILIRGDVRYIHNFVMSKTLEGAVGEFDASSSDLQECAKVDGILADLGVSSHQFDTAERGFSFRFDAPLDMRMNTEAALTAAEIVNKYEQADIERILKLYGEVDNARKIASLIVSARNAGGIRTTGELDKAIEPALPGFASHKVLAKIYQALRIEVNHEMDALREMLAAATQLLAPGGRLSVITYHSLEDRIVKNVMKAGNPEGKVEQDFFGRINTPYRMVEKLIIPSEEEQQSNPRSRSAKLRVAERKGE